MIHALSSDYQIRVFTENEIDDGLFEGLDVIAIPGGFGEADSYFDFFNRTTANRIAKFIEDGGHYLGICMGAYWAGYRYFDILDGIDAVQYIKQPNATIRRSYSTVAEVDWNGTKEHMYFYDGCAFVGEVDRCKVISRYANGDPMAIIQGRIGVIGCHPEAPKDWYEGKWKYINKYWSDGKHANLLLEFVNELCNETVINC
jgi:glutamine amidotransferase-like uncharacterized protein